PCSPPTRRIFICTPSSTRTRATTGWPRTTGTGRSPAISSSPGLTATPRTRHDGRPDTLQGERVGTTTAAATLAVHEADNYSSAGTDFRSPSGDGRYRSDLTGRPRSHGSWVTRSGHPDDEFHWGNATRRSFIEHTQPDGLATSGPATGTVGRGIREGTPSQPQQNPSHSSTTVTARRMGGPRAPHPCPAVGPT